MTCFKMILFVAQANTNDLNLTKAVFARTAY